MSQQQNCKSTIERAFEIAGSGEVSTMDRLGRILAREGHSLNMLTGPLLLKQLRQKMMASQSTQNGQ